MEKETDLFSEFQQIVQLTKGNLHILEASVPVERQMEYFNYSERVKKDGENESIDEQIQVLLSEQSPFETLKYALSFLAVSGDVKAFRALETYSKIPTTNQSLSDWTMMALLQARLTLDTELSGEKQVFIATGLGGLGNRLRFYAFFKSEGLLPFTDYQRDLIAKEFPFHIRRAQGEVEEIQIEETYFTLLFLVDLQIDLRSLMFKVITECNEYGNFIQSGFIVTNVKKFSEKEILRELQKK